MDEFMGVIDKAAKKAVFKRLSLEKKFDYLYIELDKLKKKFEDIGE